MENVIQEKETSTTVESLFFSAVRESMAALWFIAYYSLFLSFLDTPPI